jgi:acid stress chaperone HdeB
MKRTKFQATPLFVEESLIFCSPFNEAIASGPDGCAARDGGVAVAARRLFERDADAFLDVPDRAAIALEAIGRDHESEGAVQAERCCDFQPCAALRDVADRAVDATAIAKRNRALFENPISGRSPFFDHDCRSEALCTAVIALGNYGQLNSNLAVLAYAFRFRLRQYSGNVLARFSGIGAGFRRQAPRESIMKTTVSILFAAALTLSSVPAHAVVLDLSTMTCKQFVDGGDDTIKMVLTWMDGWYKGDSDEAIIDTDVFVENAKKFGAYCGKNPTISIVNAAESVLGK